MNEVIVKNWGFSKVIPDKALLRSAWEFCGIRLYTEYELSKKDFYKTSLCMK